MAVDGDGEPSLSYRSRRRWLDRALLVPGRGMDRLYTHQRRQETIGENSRSRWGEPDCSGGRGAWAAIANALVPGGKLDSVPGLRRLVSSLAPGQLGP